MIEAFIHGYQGPVYARFYKVICILPKPNTLYPADDTVIGPYQNIYMETYKKTS